MNLTSPTGTTVQVLGSAGDAYANYDVSLADANAAALNSSRGNHDPQPPYFDRAVRPAAPLLAFAGQASAGAWTLTVCDSTAGNDGSYRRGQLHLAARDAFP